MPPYGDFRRFEHLFLRRLFFISVLYHFLRVVADLRIKYAFKVFHYSRTLKVGDSLVPRLTACTEHVEVKEECSCIRTTWIIGSIPVIALLTE